jgi:hypothetical protein
VIGKGAAKLNEFERLNAGISKIDQAPNLAKPGPLSSMMRKTSLNRHFAN